MYYKKISKILCLFALTFSSAAMAQIIDSTLPRPNGGPSIGKLNDKTPSELETQTPDASTITEYLKEVCPSGLTGPDGTNMITVSQRHVTTYRYNGNIVGTSQTPWEDVDEECKGREVRDLSCPPDKRGQYRQERTKVTSDNNTFEYSDWRDIINSCSYYRLRNDYEESTASCPSGYRGNIINRRGFEVWSDGSHRNHGQWYQHANNCYRDKKPGNSFLVSASGKTFGANGTHTGSLSLNNETSRLVCSGSMSSYNERPGDRPTQTVNGPFRTDYASCSLSNDGLSGSVSGSCDTTSGGDGDYCVGAVKRASIISISEDECAVEVSVQHRSYGQPNVYIINTCN